MISTDTSHGKSRKSKLLRKVLIAVGCLFGLLTLAAIIVPLVIDVDKYRPLIVQKANERLNGKLELGKLGLSLWGRVNVDIDQLKLTDARGTSVVEVKDASLNIPLMSILTGSPRVRLVLDQPVINVIKGKDGRMNVTTLMKEPAPGTASGSSAPAVGDTKAAPSQGEATEIPGILLNSRLTFILDRAKLNYRDELTGDVYKVDDLNFRLQDVSPTGTMPFEVNANLAATLQNKIKINGPAVLEGEVKALSENGSFDRANATVSLKLDGLEITDPGVFNKAKGVPLGADFKADVTKETFNVPDMKFKLADVTIDGQASGKMTGTTTTIDFKAHSNQVDVEKLAGLSPLIKEYGLNGLVELNVRANGPTTNLDYGADIGFKKVTLNHESLKQPLEVNGSMSVATNQVKNMKVRMTAKDFDLDLNGSVQNFAAPRFQFNLNSSNMDLDGLMKASAKAADNRKQQAKTVDGDSVPADAGTTKSAQGNVVDYNAMFEPLRKNPTAAAAAGTFDFNLKRVKSTGVVINNMHGQMALNNLLLALKDFSMGVFDGQIKGGMSFNAKPAKPEVATNITVSGLQTQKMVESQMPIARNSIKGVVGANLNIGGPGVNQSDIVSTWKGNGTMNIQNAVFSTIDIGKQVREGALNKLPDFAKGKINIPEGALSKQGEYENVLMKFVMNPGTLNITEINGKAYPNKGFDLKGAGTVRLSDYALDLNLDIIDTYNISKGEQHIGKDARYNHFTLSPKVGGTLFSPKFDWAATMGKLAEAALKGKGREALQKALGDKVPGGILNNPKPADAVKVFKGLFGK